MQKAVIVGGSKGLGFAILNKIKEQYDSIVVFDIVEPLQDFNNVTFIKCDLSKQYFKFDYNLVDVDALIITAGFGSVRHFEDISKPEIKKLFNINIISVSQILNDYFPILQKEKEKKCFVMGSIAGEIVSPLFAIYGAAKSALNSLCESLNIELEKSGSSNRITYGSAVSFNGSSFTGKETNLNELDSYADLCIDAMNRSKEKVYFDKSLCEEIIDKYRENPRDFGLSSYEYKMKNNRLSSRKDIIIGYLSGTFDLFHVGHLNLLKRAKEQCDYLIVGVHRSGSWKGKETFIPFEERFEIVKSIKYVDEVHESLTEDSDAWNIFHFDKLFVGSDYKGTERFLRYEEYFKNKGVEIVYFPYTKSTNSTQIRDKIKNHK